MQIIITDYTVNSLGYAFQQQGVFNWWFIPEDLPPDFPIKMNTKDWACKYYASLRMAILIKE